MPQTGEPGLSVAPLFFGGEIASDATSVYWADESARTICSGRDFHECVALPLWAALRDTTTPSVPRSETAAHLDSASGDVVVPMRKAAPAGTRVTGWLGIVDSQVPRTR